MSILSNHEKTAEFKKINFSYESLRKEISPSLVYLFLFSCCNATYHGKKVRKQYLVSAFERLGMTTLTAMQVKNPEKLAIIDNIWIEGQNVRFDDFMICL